MTFVRPPFWVKAEDPPKQRRSRDPLCGTGLLGAQAKEWVPLWGATALNSANGNQTQSGGE
jgi:hypothetical protein